MRGVALLLLVCCACTLAFNINDHKNEEFRAFVNKYGKAYRASPEEYAFRQQIFFKKLDLIEEMNKQGNSFQVGINEYADLSDAEYASMLTQVNSNTNNIADPNVEVAAPPSSVDWRNKTNPVIVGPVRNMGQCTSSVAISVVDSIAADYSIKFSEDFYQFDTAYVTDCDGQKCNGGTTNVTWSFIQKFGLQWYYDGCPTAPGVGICIQGTSCVAKGDEAALQNAVATKGPISISIDASQASFQLYTSGIYYEPKCSSTNLNFALLLVGYGSSNGQDYWIARNEWGSSWGQNGDVLLARNKNNNCGVASSACYATTVGRCVCAL